MVGKTYSSVFALTEAMLGQLPEGHFVRNGAYATIAELVRDTQFAPERITGFATECGFNYRLWTKKADYDYLTMCFAQEGDELVVTIDVLRNKDHPDVVFDLLIEFWSTEHLNLKFASCRQTIACQVPNQKGHYGKSPTTWNKITNIADFVRREMQT